MASVSPDELLKLLRQKQEELDELQAAKQANAQEQLLQSKLEAIQSKVDFSHVRSAVMWAPPVFVVWGLGYLSNLDLAVALTGLLLVAAVTTFASVYSLLKSEEAQKAAALTKPKVAVDERDANTKVRSAKKGGSKKEAEKSEELSVAGTMSWKTWLVPFTILWLSRDNMTDLEMLMCVAGLIATMLIGSRAVRTMENMAWRKKLRGAAEHAKTR